MSALKNFCNALSSLAPFRMSHSQTTRTLNPSARSAAILSASRAWFRASFAPRRHGPWARDQQTLLSDDGRRHHRRERARPRIDLHNPAAESGGDSQGRGGWAEASPGWGTGDRRRKLIEIFGGVSLA